MTEKKKFTEIPAYEPEQFKFEGLEKVALDSILNQEVAIIEFEVRASNFFEGDFAYVKFRNNLDETKFFSTSSQVLIKQLNELQEKQQLPRRLTITRIKRYYTIKRA